MKMTLNSWVAPNENSPISFLGDPRLYETRGLAGEIGMNAATWAADLHNVMEEIRAKYNLPSDCGTAQLGHCETARLYEY
jgi:hypothetical protein